MRQDKHLLLDEITDSMNKFDSFFVMRYAGLKANTANSFRREVLKQGGDVHIMRKRLLLKAAESVGVTLDNILLDGHIGVVFADQDPMVMLKSLIQFSKENGEAVKLVGGYAEKQVFDAQQVARLAELPSKPEMQAQLLGTLEAPLSQTLAVMDALVASAVYCLDNYISKQQADDTADAASS